MLDTSADPGTTQFRFLTWNVMGFTTIADELELIISEQDPDIIVLTETKFVRDQHGSANIRKPFLGNYNICSSVAASTRAQKLIRNREGRQNLHQNSGARGVVLAVHNRWQPEASMHLHTHSQEPWLASHAIGVTASNSSGASCNIFGVYMPAEVRQQIYNHLKKHATQANTILLGDWNADPERPKLTTADHMHRHFLLSHLNFGSVGACRPTFHSSQAKHYFSSLDHIILRKDLSGFEHHLQALDSSGSSDHSPLLMQLLHPDLLRVPEEEPSPPFRSSLVHPVPKNALQKFKDATTCALAAKLGQMAEPSSLVTSSELEEHMCHLHSILSSDAMQLARDTRPFTKYSLGVNMCGPTAQEKLTTSSLYQDMAMQHSMSEPEEKRPPKCMAKVYLLMQLGITGLTDLMETRDGLLYMISASTLQARYPRAQKLHLHLFHQITAYL